MKHFAACLLIAALLQGCCTKKACIGPPPPHITLEFADAGKYSGSKMVIYSFSGTALLDSVIYDEFYTTKTLHPVYFENGKPLLVTKYIIKTGVGQDEITGITCAFREVEVKCNECFPFRVQKETETHFENFSFQFRNKTFGENDVVVIKH